ncbi:hypothetical protein XENOCAPTIV_027704 [Xenoophorus captivus]|uniref:Uncharacterized protein n=1 Tax=Xenoophorus captivus TaxID=1517983 RepID=A0ABV0RW08_9TELE
MFQKLKLLHMMCIVYKIQTIFLIKLRIRLCIDFRRAYSQVSLHQKLHKDYFCRFSHRSRSISSLDHKILQLKDVNSISAEEDSVSVAVFVFFHMTTITSVCFITFPYLGLYFESLMSPICKIFNLAFI